jgi:hypothetical protein
MDGCMHARMHGLKPPPPRAKSIGGFVSRIACRRPHQPTGLSRSVSQPFLALCVPNNWSLDPEPAQFMPTYLCWSWGGRAGGKAPERGQKKQIPRRENATRRPTASPVCFDVHSRTCSMHPSIVHAVPTNSPPSARMDE